MKINLNLPLEMFVKFLAGKPCVVTGSSIESGAANKCSGITATNFTFRASMNDVHICGPDDNPNIYEIILREGPSYPPGRHGYIKVFIESHGPLNNEQLNLIAKNPCKYISFEKMYGPPPPVVKA